MFHTRQPSSVQDLITTSIIAAVATAARFSYMYAHTRIINFNDRFITIAIPCT